MQGKYYQIQPEIASGWGQDTQINRTIEPQQIIALDYEFDDWLGSDIVGALGCVLASEKIAKQLQSTHLQGFSVETCKISFSEVFHDLHPDGLTLPQFYWLKINGKPYLSDFWFDGSTLTISEKAYQVLSQGNLSHCEVVEKSG